MSRSTRILAGAIGGAVGSGLMAIPILGARSAGLIDTPPPQQITRGLLEAVDVRMDRDTEGAATVLSHVAFGVVAGALYGIVAPRTPHITRALAMGLAYAMGIYLVSYAGWVPALRLLPPAQKDDPRRQSVMIVAHLVFGASLAVAMLAEE